MKKWFYERNDELINSNVNVTFEQVLDMTPAEFRQWIIDLRALVTKLWDEKGLPPRVGYTESEIVAQFDDMITYPVHEFVTKDETTGKTDVIRNTSIIGNAVNQWFPTMMATRINYSAKDDGLSIYDHFAKPELLDKFITYASRHFKRDSFYAYSQSVVANDKTNFENFPVAKDAIDFIEQFEKSYRSRGQYDYWLAPIDEDKAYTGYKESLKDAKFLNITLQDLIEVRRRMLVDHGINIPNRVTSNTLLSARNVFQVRVFKLGQKLFPVGFKAFRVSFCQYATNFPPLVAKHLYERFTDKIKDQKRIVIYDPSSGWGGRIAGAMAVKDDRNIHYVGTDPNTDHTTTPGRTKYHELADFINENTCRATSLFPSAHSYEIFQLGSEVIGKDKGFKKYKGKVDLVFTSPPYFAKEAYSEDPEQSYKKFTTYATWRDGFLRPTLETAVEWLANERYLLWNIADAKFGNEMLPLEEDSNEILRSLGMKYIETLKMTLANMPGGNRIDEETGKPKAKNTVRVNGLWIKYEPIFVWYKP